MFPSPFITCHGNAQSQSLNTKWRTKTAPGLKSQISLYKEKRYSVHPLQLSAEGCDEILTHETSELLEHVDSFLDPSQRHFSVSVVWSKQLQASKKQVQNVLFF